MDQQKHQQHQQQQHHQQQHLELADSPRAVPLHMMLGSSVDNSGLTLGSTGMVMQGMQPYGGQQEVNDGLRAMLSGEQGNFVDGPVESRINPFRAQSGAPLPCFDWTKGLCTRGDKCKFSHDLDTIVTFNSKEKGICFDYLRNQCHRGLLCRFSHDLSHIAQQCQVSTTMPAPAKGRATAVCYDFVKGVCQRGNECRYSHDLSLIARTARGGTQTQKSGELCYDYLRGRCNRGNSCKYSHNISFITSPGVMGGQIGDGSAFVAQRQMGSDDYLDPNQGVHGSNTVMFMANEPGGDHGQMGMGGSFHGLGSNAMYSHSQVHMPLSLDSNQSHGQASSADQMTQAQADWQWINSNQMPGNPQQSQVPGLPPHMPPQAPSHFLTQQFNNQGQNMSMAAAMAAVAAGHSQGQPAMASFASGNLGGVTSNHGGEGGASVPTLLQRGNSAGYSMMLPNQASQQQLQHQQQRQQIQQHLQQQQQQQVSNFSAMQAPIISSEAPRIGVEQLGRTNSAPLKSMLSGGGAPSGSLSALISSLGDNPQLLAEALASLSTRGSQLQLGPGQEASFQANLGRMRMNTMRQQPPGSGGDMLSAANSQMRLNNPIMGHGVSSEPGGRIGSAPMLYASTLKSSERGEHHQGMRPSLNPQDLLALSSETRASNLAGMPLVAEVNQPRSADAIHTPYLHQGLSGRLSTARGMRLVMDSNGFSKGAVVDVGGRGGGRGGAGSEIPSGGGVIAMITNARGGSDSMLPGQGLGLSFRGGDIPEEGVRALSGSIVHGSAGMGASTGARGMGTNGFMEEGLAGQELGFLKPRQASVPFAPAVMSSEQQETLLKAVRSMGLTGHSQVVMGSGPGQEPSLGEVEVKQGGQEAGAAEQPGEARKERERDDRALHGPSMAEMPPGMLPFIKEIWNN